MISYTQVKEKNHEMQFIENVYVDEYIEYVGLVHHLSLGIVEGIEWKHQWEIYVYLFGVIVSKFMKSYAKNSV